MGSYYWLYRVIGLTQQHTWLQFTPALHDWSWGEAAPGIVIDRWSRPWKNLWWPTNSTTSSIRGIIRDNEIDSFHPISDELITGLLLQGSLGEVLHAELVPFCSQTPVTSSLLHMPALSFPVLLKWWPQWIPEPSPPSRAQNAPSLASNASGENEMLVSGTQGTQSLQPFRASSWGGATNNLLGAAMVRHFCSESIHFFHLEALSRCLSWDRGQRLISFRLTGLISFLYKRLSRIFSSTTVQKLSSSAFTLSYGPDHTSVHDYWKNHSFDTTYLCSKVSLCFLIHCAGFS